MGPIGAPEAQIGQNGQKIAQNGIFRGLLVGVKSTRRGDRSVFQGGPRWFKPSRTPKKARRVPELAWDVSEKSAKLARERPPSRPKSAKMAEKWPKMAFFGGDWWGSNRPVGVIGRCFEVIRGGLSPLIRSKRPERSPKWLGACRKNRACWPVSGLQAGPNQAKWPKNRQKWHFSGVTGGGQIDP